MEYGESERLFTAFPLFHVNASTRRAAGDVPDRRRCVLHNRFSASRFWDICREGVTGINYMGALILMLHKQPEGPTTVTTR